jgi:hypothetical protein
MTTPCSAPPWRPFPRSAHCRPAARCTWTAATTIGRCATGWPRGLHARIAERGKPAPIQAGHRWVIERTHAWMNNYGKLIRCTERHKPVVEFYLALATAIVTLGRLIRQA